MSVIVGIAWFLTGLFAGFFALGSLLDLLMRRMPKLYFGALARRHSEKMIDALVEVGALEPRDAHDRNERARSDQMELLDDERARSDQMDGEQARTD